MPNTDTAPASGRNRPATMRKVVVLPAPLGPSKRIKLADSDGEIERIDRKPVKTLG